MRWVEKLVVLDGPRCHYCQHAVGIAGSADHVRPKSQGGTDGIENLVLACRSCNTRKGSMSYYDFAALYPFRSPLPQRVREYLGGIHT